ncbi:MAG TPA: OmpA family protein [Terriglobales bacterium]|nr:OmpA family protein [Terriglobales bacterium]
MSKGIFTIFILCAAFDVGCASKSYVHNQVTPLIQKVNAMEDQAAQNNRQIGDVDYRTQRDIQALGTRVSDADLKATTAGTKAAQADQTAHATNAQVDSLANTVVNLDSYRTVTEVSVLFGLGRDKLTAENVQVLNNFVAQLPRNGNFVITMEGSTDAIGDKELNYTLSKRRAQTVMSYLATKDVPVQAIHSVALGADRPVAPNNTIEGRAKNRRVDVSLIMHSGKQAQVQTGQIAPGVSSITTRK